MKKANIIRVFLPLFIIIACFFCLHNGVKVSKLPELSKEPDSIVLFYIISLFTFGAKEFGAPISGPFFLQSLMWFCYFVAPLVTIVAMADVLLVMRPWFINYVLRFKPYYLIIGYGRIGKSAMEAVQKRDGKKTYFIVLDKNTDETENDFSVIFEHVLVLKKNLNDQANINKFITHKCRGIFVLTDQEMLNLRVYNDLKTHLQSEGIRDVEGFTRILSLEILNRLGAKKKLQNPTSNDGWPKHQFINVHVAAPNLLYDSPDKLIQEEKNDEIIDNFNSQYQRFHRIMETAFDTFVFIGFGTFSSSFFLRLVEEGKINTNSTIVIIDPLARKNWGSFVLDKPEVSIFDPELFDTEFEAQVDSVSFSFTKYIKKSSLCFFATSDEEKNIQSASYFNRKYKNNSSIHSIIRTKNMDVIPPELMDALLGNQPWVMVPTYTWIKISFQKALNNR